MKILYIECNMGAAGDMLMSALFELIDDKDGFLAQMNGLGLRDVRVAAHSAETCGIKGTHISVIIGNTIEEQSIDVDIQAHSLEHDHHHHHDHDHHHNHNHEHEHNHNHDHDHHPEHHHEHRSLHSIEHILSHLQISAKVRGDALSVYHLIAEAEAHAHGCELNQIHFHEVGILDAIADIVGVCLLMEGLGAERVIVSPVHVGSGFVRCAHGVLPVPAPATAYLLQDVPSYGGTIRGELCTPTGAALLKHFADDFAPMPVMRTMKIGYGMGTKEFEAANCVRVFFGETEKCFQPSNGTVAELQCNIDDMSGEQLGYACQTLREAGARDVFTTAIQMKKNRPAVLLTCICDTGRANEFASLLLQHTTTFGVRRSTLDRYTLSRHIEKISTPYGEVRIKSGSGYGIAKAKPEYEDMAELARRNNISINEAEQIIRIHMKQSEEHINE